MNGIRMSAGTAVPAGGGSVCGCEDRVVGRRTRRDFDDCSSTEEGSDVTWWDWI